jgi:hypothetical protein
LRDVQATARPPDDAISGVLNSHFELHSENSRFQEIDHEPFSAKEIGSFSLWHGRCKAEGMTEPSERCLARVNRSLKQHIDKITNETEDKPAQ